MNCIKCQKKIYNKKRQLCLNHYWQWQSAKRSGHSREIMHKIRFGGIRETVIYRDGEKCVICKMTRIEHKKRWNLDISIDHIDGQGRNTKNPNNKPENLRTLCLSCHGRIDSLRGWSIHARKVGDHI